MEATFTVAGESASVLQRTDPRARQCLLVVRWGADAGRLILGTACGGEPTHVPADYVI
jgi:hypothetical protein